ncbi:hypothetical protein OIU78_018856 [Salix suchowensis]|nr:hypothetical protein OIU78_018856 [Salix suchowensis]
MLSGCRPFAKVRAREREGKEIEGQGLRRWAGSLMNLEGGVAARRAGIFRTRSAQWWVGTILGWWRILVVFSRGPREEPRQSACGVRWASFYCPVDYPASNIPRYEFIEDQEEEDSRPQSIVIALQIVAVDCALLLPIFAWVWGALAAGFKPSYHLKAVVFVVFVVIVLSFLRYCFKLSIARLLACFLWFSLYLCHSFLAANGWLTVWLGCVGVC